jgi:hypothetical protein
MYTLNLPKKAYLVQKLIILTDRGIDVTLWATAETAASIIGASIPAIRSLYVGKFPNRRDYPSDPDPDLPLAPFNGTKRTIGGGILDEGLASTDRRASAPASSGWSAEVSTFDNGSERSIVPGNVATTNKRQDKSG